MLLSLWSVWQPKQVYNEDKGICHRNRGMDAGYFHGGDSEPGRGAASLPRNNTEEESMCCGECQQMKSIRIG